MVKVLHVQMFDKFEIYYGDQKLALERSYTTKAMQMLQYFLYNKEQKFSRDELLNVLYSHDDVLDPSNNLKVNMFRLRKVLAKSGFPESEFIVFQEGKYALGSQISIILDVDEFTALLTPAVDQVENTTEKIERIMKGLALYQGELLPLLAIEEWVTIESLRCKTLYLENLMECCKLLDQEERYNEVIDLCERAITIYPLEEECHLTKICCLMKMKRFQEALNAYNLTTKLFFDELGITPTKEMEAVYRTMCDEAENSTLSLFEIKNNLQEAVNAQGAYYCNYLSFIDGYHIVTRLTERTGQAAYLMLCTLATTSGKTLVNGERLLSAATCLQHAIKKTLRRGDTYTRYTTGQFLILLVGIEHENCTLVTKRIDNIFKSCCPMRGLRIDYHTVSAAEFISENTHTGFDAKFAIWTK